MGNPRLHSLLVAAALMTVTTVALVVYGSGFMLYRPTVPDKTPGLYAPATARYRRLIFVVIDALRYDFSEWQSNATQPFHNRMLWFREVMQLRPTHCFLSKFISDPPTTTMQRIKGLTTGSLPTFVDAGSNFAGAEVDEDSWIFQAHHHSRDRRRRNLVLLGDDTWASLFPTQFDRTFAFPSFDTHDLHTVDNGILSVLDSELSRDDWWIAVVHFLGVDHAGHYVGPNSLALPEKLSQMDGVLRGVSVKYLTSENDLLLVIGDHGMTPTGDHGGDTRSELEATLFAYSPGGLRPVGDESALKERRDIPQIDLVPTLSTLLGLPIPFSNLGSVIPELFPSDREYELALELNKKQLAAYLSKYLSGEGSPDARLKSLATQLNGSTNAEDVALALRDITAVFREVWSQFNLKLMFCGIVLYFSTLLFALSHVAGVGISRLVPEAIKRISVPCRCFLRAFSVAHTKQHAKKGSQPGDETKIDNDSVIPAVVIFATFFTSVGSLSNSYVIYEDAVLRFLLNTLLLLISLIHYAESIRSGTISWKNMLKSRDLHIRAGSLAACLIVTRSGNLWNRCREEQRNCDGLPWLAAPPGFLDADTRLLRIVLATGCLALAMVLAYWFLSANGNLKRQSLLCLVAVPYLFFAVSLAIVSHWLVSLAPDGLVANAPYAKYFPSQMVLLFLVLITVIWLADPVMTVYYATPPVDSQQFANRLRNEQRLANAEKRRILKELFSNGTDQNQPVSILNTHGLSTCLSAPFVVILSVFGLLFALILGDGVAPSICSGMFVIALILHNSESQDLAVLGFYLLSQHLFYAFGHHANFSYIPWEPAFLFCPPAYRQTAVQATLVALNVLASQFLIGLGLPIIAIWNARSHSTSSLETKSEWSNVLNGSVKTEAARNVTLYLTLMLARVFGSLLASGVHRRHLMAWKIFAPKFLFDSAGLGVTFLAVIIGHLFFLRVEGRLGVLLREMNAKIS